MRWVLSVYRSLFSSKERTPDEFDIDFNGSSRRLRVARHCENVWHIWELWEQGKITNRATATRFAQCANLRSLLGNILDWTMASGGPNSAAFTRTSISFSKIRFSNKAFMATPSHSTMQRCGRWPNATWRDVSSSCSSRTFMWNNGAHR